MFRLRLLDQTGLKFRVDLNEKKNTIGETSCISHFYKLFFLSHVLKRLFMLLLFYVFFFVFVFLT